MCCIKKLVCTKTSQSHTLSFLTSRSFRNKLCHGLTVCVLPLCLLIQGVGPIDVSKESYWSLSNLFGKVPANIKKSSNESVKSCFIFFVFAADVCHQQGAAEDVTNH